MTMQAQLGDMLVVGKPPLALLRPLAVIADSLHRAFDAAPRIEPGISKESCVLCSLTVRDFLRAIGLRASVASVGTIMWAREGGRELHSLGIGAPEDTHANTATRWNGHMVAIACGYLIDTTLYRARRPAWPDLAPMIALPLNREPEQFRGLTLTAAASLTDSERPDYEFNIVWLDRPHNTDWRSGPDRERSRRVPVVRHLLSQFQATSRIVTLEPSALFESDSRSDA